MSLAIRALDTAMPTDRPGIACFDPRADLTQIQDDDLVPKFGYVLDFTGRHAYRDRDRIVNDLAARARGIDRECYLLVVLDDGVSLEALPVVHHIKPEQMAVLATLLVRRHGLEPEVVDGLEPLVHDAVRAATLGQVADVATAVAAAVAAGEKPEPYIRECVRAQVRRKLDEPLPEKGNDDIRRFRHAFLLSAAVLNGLALETVTVAAQTLAAILRGSDGAPVTTTTSFAEATAELLEWVEADALDPADEPFDAAATRRVRLRNAALPDVVLEVVWTDHHQACTPVLKWLDRLALNKRGEPSPDEVRLRAAQAVGRLATYDFQRVFDDTIENWIGRGTVSGRQAASWAVEMTLADERIAPAVWDRVRRWSMRGATWRQAALLIYANALNPDRIPDALALVRNSAGGREHKGSYAIAAVVRAVALAGGEDDAFQLLETWLAQLAETRRSYDRKEVSFIVLSRLPVDVARSLVLLAEQGPGGARDLLLRAVEATGGSTERPDRWPTFVALWRLALTTPGVTRRAWDLLEAWKGEAEDNDDLAGVYRRLRASLGRDPVTRHRLGRYEARWGNGRPGGSGDQHF